MVSYVLINVKGAVAPCKTLRGEEVLTIQPRQETRIRTSSEPVDFHDSRKLRLDPAMLEMLCVQQECLAFPICITAALMIFQATLP